MAAQLEIIKFRDVLDIGSIGFVRGITPTTMHLKGTDLSKADRIIINEMDSPEFIIIDKQTIYAQLPLGVSRIASIEVISSGFTRSISASKLTFEIGNKTRKVEGVLKLVQLFAKWILQSPGSDIFNPSRGGGLQEIVGKVSTTRDLQPIFATITRAISITTTQIRSAQINVPELPLSERLLSANLVDIDIYEANMEARAKVRLISVAGESALSDLVL